MINMNNKIILDYLITEIGTLTVPESLVRTFFIYNKIEPERGLQMLAEVKERQVHIQNGKVWITRL